jgi:uncharacterized protein GlcG (DUF336 family)
MNRKLLAAFLSMVAMGTALAQTPPATPPATPAAAAPQQQVLPPEKSIPLALALEAVQAAVDSCKAANSLAAVEVVDLNDNVKAMLVADGARPALSDLARRKAYTVIKKNMSSGDFGKSVGAIPRGTIIEGDANLITFAGALPIKRGNDMIGAISVSGPTGAAADEACAQAGLDKIKGRL